MLRHQQLFNAMNQQIDSGIDMLDEYNVTIESLDAASDLLGRLHNGDTSAVIDAQARFGSQMSGEGVSMEGVQIHVNSNQVQMVIDFLKKWIPILIAKIKQVFRQFVAWVKQKLAAIEARLKNLKRWIQETAQSNVVVELHYSGEAPLGVVAFSSQGGPLFHSRGLSDAMRWVESLVDAADRDSGFTRISGGVDFVSSMSEWLTLNREHELFPKVGHFDSDADVAAAVSDMPSPTSATSVAKADFMSSMDHFWVNLSKPQIGDWLNKLDNCQLVNNDHAQKMLKSFNSLEVRLAKLERASRTYEDGRAGRYQTAVKAVSYALNAAQAGLQFRLQILSSAVSLMETSTGFKR